MKEQAIALERFLSRGQITCEFRDSMLYMTTNHAIPTQRFDAEHLSINSYVYLPEKYKLPLRIDITAKIDAPGFYVLLGRGHVNFGTMWSDNRMIDDIASPSRKTLQFYNHVDMDKFSNISLIYGLKEMQIVVDGEVRYHSNKERYMKAAAIKEISNEGLEIKIACDKLVNLCLKSVTITEYDDDCEFIPSDGELPTAITKNMAVKDGEKPDFEKCIASLPKEIQVEIVKTDAFLKNLKPLRFKRQIEKNGNKITYIAADYGVSYAIYLSNDIFDHSLQWYIITNGKPDTWHRKADGMEVTLKSLNCKAPDFAQQMFYNLEDCVGCYRRCLARTRYAFNGSSKAVCHGKLRFKMSPLGFEELRSFVKEVNRLVQTESV